MTGADSAEGPAWWTHEDVSSFRVAVVGTGLIGTSIGLALRRRGMPVFLSDSDPAHLAAAIRLGAGREWQGESVTHAVLAVPPDAVTPQLARLSARYTGLTFSDTTSIKAQLQREIETTGDALLYCGAHPMAGGETSGPSAARAELFAARAWVLTPTARTSAQARHHARLVALACDARVVELSPEAHDDAVALISHVPQLLASLLAARLTDATETAVDLAGTGLRDMTRIALSDASLWAQIVAANSAPIAAVLGAVAADLDDLLGSLRAVGADDQAPSPGHPPCSGDSLVPGGPPLASPSRTSVREHVQALVERGNIGRNRLRGER